jgi:predicted transposase/invertase (TIGR01784 family)
MCKEVKGLELGDETSKVIYNTTAVNDDNKTYKDLNISKRLYNLLRYVEKQDINDKFTKKLDEKVNSIKKDNDWREKHMQYELNIQDAKREGIAIGKTEGIAIGKNEGIREGQENIIKKMLESGMSYEEVSRIVDMSVDLVKRYAGEIIKA